MHVTDTPLEKNVRRALQIRRENGVPIRDISTECSFEHPTADFFSSDYLSLTSNNAFRFLFLHRMNETRSLNILGSTGSRLLCGNGQAHVALERRMQEFFQAPAALMFSSGFDANLAFFSAMPQEGDVIVHDEFLHSSCLSGIDTSRARRSRYPFAHNSIDAFKKCLYDVLERHPSISQKRKGTVFIALESLYSMDGDFAPLEQMIQAAEEIIPSGCAHIFVDEAHTTGMCGPQGRGVVAFLGLQSRVHSVLHTFGKARGVAGAVILTSQIIHQYLQNYARPMLYSTAMPYFNVIALNCSFDFLAGESGQTLIDRLHHLTAYFQTHLRSSLTSCSIPLKCLSVNPPANNEPFPSPVIPLFTSYPLPLTDFLQNLGYAAQAIPHPIVPLGTERVRVCIHSGNTETEIHSFVAALVEWAIKQAKRNKMLIVAEARL